MKPERMILLLLLLVLGVGCAPVKPYTYINKKTRDVDIPLSAFEERGFVVIARTDADDIFVRKGESNNFAAYFLRCSKGTHTLKVKGKHLKCTEEGSRFDFNGQVLRGPAEEPLIQIDTEVIGDKLRVLIREIT